jgi:hypothetical protein
VEGGKKGGGREQCVGPERGGDAGRVGGRGGIDGDFESDAEDVPLAAVFSERIGCGG